MFTNGEELIKNGLHTFLADVIIKFRGVSFHSEFANREAKKDTGFCTGSAYMSSLGDVCANDFGISGRYASLTTVDNFSSLL